MRDRATYANVIATLVVSAALGGTSYAVLQVGSDDVVDNSLRSRDIRNNSVRSRDIRARSPCRNSTVWRRRFRSTRVAQGSPRALQRNTAKGVLNCRQTEQAWCSRFFITTSGRRIRI